MIEIVVENVNPLLQVVEISSTSSRYWGYQPQTSLETPIFFNNKKFNYVDMCQLLIGLHVSSLS
jgi:hypothetical protein